MKQEINHAAKDRRGRETGSNASTSPWYSRGYLPHCDEPGRIQHITFRLHDSIPHTVIQRWKGELGITEITPSNDPAQITLYQRIERNLDAGFGACFLCRHDIADLVQDALLHFDGTRYHLLAWCIMPNHVHAMIDCTNQANASDSEGKRDRMLGKIVHSWKSFTASKANRKLGRKGPFWMREYHDRFIRNAAHFLACVDYIHRNPVKARLCQAPVDWRWSLARYTEAHDEQSG